MIRNSLKVALIIAGAGLWTAGLAAGATISTEKLARYAKLPDWSGLWVLKGNFSLLDKPNAAAKDTRPGAVGRRDHPPYNAEWEAKYGDALRRAAEQGDPNATDPIIDTHTIYCAYGMPRVMLSPFNYQFIHSPGMSWINAGGEIRLIYTDGRKRPDADTIWPKLFGWSTGQWRGETLEVETTDVMPGLWADGTPLVFSAQAKFNERIYMVDANTIQIDMVITDPVAFTRPWKVTRQYVRDTVVDWMDERYVCTGPNDRTTIENGRLTTKPQYKEQG